MAIAPDDIKLLSAQRPTDEPDGGGRITGNVLQSGVDNNLFDDVSDLDRVTGVVSLRKFGVGVLSTGTEKYLGSRIMISQIPADPKVHAVLFAPEFDDDTRSDAVSKVASYLAPGGTYPGYLYGNHLAGMPLVIMLQRAEVPVPVVGDVLYLVKNEDEIDEVNQFVQITTVGTLLRTFTDTEGDFTRLQVTLGISEALEVNFSGFEAVRLDAALNYIGKTRLRESIVADAAQYFGTRRLATAATVGAMTINAGSMFAQLLPSNRVETALADLNPTPPANLGVGSGETVEFVHGLPFNPATALQLPGPCVPGSVVLGTSAGDITDSAGVLYLAGTQVGYIDTTAGTLNALAGAAFDAPISVAYEPAGLAVRAPQATGLAITLANRAQTYVAFLDPPPPPGSTVVSYRSGGRWYVLSDDGSGGLRGSSTSFGAGQVNPDTGFLAVSLGALPDVGSYLMITSGAPSQETLWPLAALKARQKIALPIGTGGAVQPGTVVLTWPAVAGGTHTASDAAVSGTLAGHATGTVSYARNEIEFLPDTLPAPGAIISVAYFDAPKQVDTFASPARDGLGKVPVTASLGAIEPGSLEVEWDTTIDSAFLTAYTLDQMAEMGAALAGPTHIARDDGAGNIKLNGANVGTVNYGTGAVLLSPDVVVKVPKPNYSVKATVTAGTEGVSGGGMPAPGTAPSTRWRINFKGMTYVNATSVYPSDASGRVELRYNSAAGTAAATHEVAFAPGLELLGDVRPALMPGALTLRVGGEIIGDSGNGTLRTPQDGTWLARGTVSYTNATAALTSWPAGATNSFERLACISSVGNVLSSDFVFRTASAPLVPSSFSIRFARATGGTQIVTANAEGVLSAAGVLGTIDWETGICQLMFGTVVTAAGNEAEPWYDAANVVEGQIWRPEPVAVSTVRYAAVAYTYLPLGAEILGLPPVRLPADGRVPVLKKARVIVVHHTKSTDPQTVSNGTVVNTGRTLLAWARVYGADGLEITSGFAKDLDTGTVTFTDVAGYSQPVSVMSRIETEALCADAQIDGTLQLLRPLAHDYPADETLVSSVMIGGTLQAGVSQGFSQQTWTNEWADARIGDPILAQYDQTTYPIEVSNNGTITQRVAFIFQSNPAEFVCVFETRGQIAEGNTATDFAPVNPATGVPYFTVRAGGWGAGWSAGNVYRPNFRGAIQVGWCARTVEQSPPGSAGSDQVVIEVRGSIDA